MYRDFLHQYNFFPFENIISNENLYKIIYKFWDILNISVVISLTIILSIVLLLPFRFLHHTLFEFFKTGNEHKTKFLKGAQLSTVEKINKEIVKKYGKFSKTFIKLGNILLPKVEENRGCLLIGAPGSGKSVLLKILFSQILLRDYNNKNNDYTKMIIYDRKPEFIDILYRKKHDYIFYPSDKNSIKFDIGSEVKSRADVRFLIENLIPVTPDDKQPVFGNSAQLILEAILLYLLDCNTLSNKNIIDFLRKYNTPVKLKMQLRDTAYKYAINLDFFLQDDSQFTGSIMGNFTASVVKKLCIEEFYYNNNQSFSIDNYLNSNDKKNLYIVNPSSTSALYGSYYAIFIAFLSRKIRSLSNDTSRRLWLILDEFQTLKTGNEKGVGSILSLLAEGRQKGASVVLATQSLAQVKALYRDEGLIQILNNTSTKIFLQNSAYEDQQIIVNILGKGQIKEFSASDTLCCDVNQKHTLHSSVKEKNILLESEIGQLEVIHTKKGVTAEGYIKISDLDPCKFEFDSIDFNTIYEVDKIDEVRGFSTIENEEETEQIHKKEKKRHNIDVDTL